MDRFRKAESGAKDAAIVPLRAVQCSTADVCATRSACLGSAEATLKALQLKHDVEQGLRALESGSLAREGATATALPAQLDRAQRLLNEGFQGLATCDAQVLALKRTYRL